MKYKVKIITCYYGKFPNYIDLWMHSCLKNPNFEFMIVTDSKLNDLPQNVNVINLKLEDIQEKISSILGYKVNLITPYKLCDYKPLYGEIFKSELEGYDFWGHCDLDMIWGDLEKFITDDMLNTYDIIGKRGALILYRNNRKINNLYKMSGGIFSSKEVFTSKENFGFDEMTGMNLIAIKNGIKRFSNLKIGDALRYNKRLTVRGTRKGKEFFCKHGKKIIRVYERQDKKINVEEYAYIHFSGKSPIVNIKKEDYESYYISSKEFKKRREKSFTLEELGRENEFCSLILEKIEKIFYKIGKIRELLFEKSFKQKIILIKMYLYLIFFSSKEV